MLFRKKNNKTINNVVSGDLYIEYQKALIAYQNAINKYNNSSEEFEEILYLSMIYALDNLNNIICLIKINNGLPLHSINLEKGY